MKRTPLHRYTPLRSYTGLARAKTYMKKVSVRSWTTRGVWNTSTADTKFSKDVRDRDKRCLLCNTTEKLTCSHFFGRKHSSTRWNLDNGDTFCLECHSAWENKKNTGDEYYEWKVKKMGLGRFMALEELARRSVPREDAIRTFMSQRVDTYHVLDEVVL